MDDLWFYDLQEHRWICCHPGSNVASLSLSLNDDGFESNAAGEPVPLSILAHAYENVAYDSGLRRLMIMPCPNHDYLDPRLRQKRDQWRKGKPLNESMASPWFFETGTGKWNRLVTAMERPASGFGDSLLYLSGERRAFFRHGQELWFYATETNAWTRVEPSGPALPFGIDATSCYDPKRNRIYIGGGSYPVTPTGVNAFRIFDLKTNAWIDPEPKGAPCGGSNSYATNIAAMAYDTVADVVIVFRFGGDDARERGIFNYDPATNTWSKSGEFPAPWGQCTNTFHDPELHVYFFHVASDSDDDGVIWVYRHTTSK
jgi:hypothetical protein